MSTTSVERKTDLQRVNFQFRALRVRNFARNYRTNIQGVPYEAVRNFQTLERVQLSFRDRIDQCIDAPRSPFRTS
ncbi:hypothetical protein WN51_12674 [Melipona quadrifasciata]|uniref:Uncharacterized protein n=1 Tax=Melipona quadrifasciata TaxID=166423 RepID=A0A0M9A0R4_9HYME|nr:hypothetical protein WN51_12674 [Melipona quadrifasciata]